MAHTYIILSATTVGDMTTITGTVDGVACTVTTWHSKLVTLPNATAVQTYLAPLMLAAAFPPVVNDVTVPLTTFNQ